MFHVKHLRIIKSLIETVDGKIKNGEKKMVSRETLPCYIKNAIMDSAVKISA